MVDFICSSGSQFSNLNKETNGPQLCGWDPGRPPSGPAAPRQPGEAGAMGPRGPFHNEDLKTEGLSNSPGSCQDAAHRLNQVPSVCL